MRLSIIRIRSPLRYSDGLDLQHVHGAELEKCDEALGKLLLLQHQPVFTLGRKTENEHLPCSEDDLSARTGAEVIRVDRGGSVTYHAPGQLTAYLLLNLRVWNIGIHEHLDRLEDVAIRTVGAFGINGRREPGMTGVWVGDPVAEKICAIGVSARRWVTYHGLSLNVDLNLAPFFEVIPCGLAGKGVTSMGKVLQRPINVSDVEDVMVKAFADVYHATTETGMV
ncbi:MAG TPA: lipoyl(octanoyl) transferase LipB [Planctomycetota bacterium]|nr:lipoyl(octanoyl) transferase LipB [Planctomycetota bacterium]